FWIGSAISDANFMYLLFVALFCIIPFGLVYYIISKNFIKIATTKAGSVKIKYVERGFKMRTAKNALLRKELRRFGSSAMYMLNTSLGLLFGVVGAVFLAVKADEALKLVNKLCVDESYLGILAAVALCGLSTMNIISAPSISLEGKNLWIPQSLPVHAREVLFAKAKLQLVISIPAMLITQIIFALALRLSAANIVVLFALPIVFAIFSSLLGVYINLLFPKFDWVSETVAVKQGISILLTMLVLTIAVALPVFVYVKIVQSHMDVLTYTLLLTALYGLASLVLYRYLEEDGAKRFERLH
ncbi:MAG: hypothetical protein GX802_03635, partial [Clostridiales bacterium]|nr:hypothetical protein [Clostridiales bacterium]